MQLTTLKSPLTSRSRYTNVIRINKDPVMAHATLNPMFKSIAGRIGSLVFYHCNDRQYMRRYVIPRNPDTPAQKDVRTRFAEAVTRWQALEAYKKNQWNMRALRMRMSGYNLYISTHMTSKEEPAPVETVQKAYSCAPPPLLPVSHSVYGGRVVVDGLFLLDS